MNPFLACIFVELYRTRTFKETCENTNLSIPSLTKYLRQLEAIFDNKPLFFRSKKGLQPTEFGHELYQELSDTYDKLIDIFEVNCDEMGDYFIGGEKDILNNILIESLDKNINYNIQLRYIMDPNIANITDHNINTGLYYDVNLGSLKNKTIVGETQLYLVANKSTMQNIQTDGLTLDEVLNHYTCLTCTNDDKLLQHYLRANTKLQTDEIEKIYLASRKSIIELLKKHNGITILPRFMLKTEDHLAFFPQDTQTMVDIVMVEPHPNYNTKKQQIISQHIQDIFANSEL